jgi:hypothetical protein
MTAYSPGDEWEDHYRGYELRINSDGDIWWQVYNGTDRLHLDPRQDDLVDQFLDLKPLGGRVRVTEGGSVITRREAEDTDGSRSSRSLDDYMALYVGDLEVQGSLLPGKDQEYEVPVRPDGLSQGDLWPSVYDGARYSFSPRGRVWWQNSRTNKHHPLSNDLPDGLSAALTGVKPEGGSFRVTPWGDVITLVRSPASKTVRDQFNDLPVVVQNIIELRRDRADLQMVPIYVGELSDLPLEVDDPPSLTDELSDEEEEALERWAASLGSTDSTNAASHRVDADSSSKTDETDADNGAETSDKDDETAEGDDDGAEIPITDDDPVAWLDRDMDKTEDRINGR